jgi:hypothetical protein
MMCVDLIPKKVGSGGLAWLYLDWIGLGWVGLYTLIMAWHGITGMDLERPLLSSCGDSCRSLSCPPVHLLQIDTLGWLS